MASLEENEVDAAIGRGEDAEEEEEEEEQLFFYVPYIHNGYILDHLGKHGNTATAKMLFDLPLCRHDNPGVLAKSISRLKNKKDTLTKKRSKSTEGENEFQQFLNSEFVFPVASQTQRS